MEVAVILDHHSSSIAVSLSALLCLVILALKAKIAAKISSQSLYLKSARFSKHHATIGAEPHAMIALNDILRRKKGNKASKEPWWRKAMIGCSSYYSSGVGDSSVET